MNMCYSFVLVLAVVGSSLAFTAEFIPKSFYVIHSNGDRSPVVNFRQKRSLQEPLFPLIPEIVRMRRSTGSGSGSGSSSYSSSYAGAGAGAGTGGNDAVYFDNLAAGFEAVAKLAGFPNGFPGGIPTGAGYGAPGYPGGVGGTAGAGYPGGAGGAAGAGYPGGAGGTAGAGYAGGVGGTGGAAYPGGAGGTTYGADAGHGFAAPNLNARFGGDDGVNYSGTADGAKGVYSASSSSIDGNGNVKYSVKTGKF